ncbi:hypothetical protein [Gordonia sp. NB41Y]|uniref:hypothetical protein n=1 Tax=Gordonia sp. NB41Y TaxID=875808 RepID=UPI0006B22E22|nr:hypothetical protein [Gordonia sp. NB41Y]KOY49685.1 hypothetical protein ISGA_08550 [Gordonia sp. NB41Y]WLP92679.1 hypothetical protein Q9K23_10855 [Gordonia sp. NB41Y]
MRSATSRLVPGGDKPPLIPIAQVRDRASSGRLDHRGPPLHPLSRSRALLHLVGFGAHHSPHHRAVIDRRQLFTGADLDDIDGGPPPSSSHPIPGRLGVGGVVISLRATPGMANPGSRRHTPIGAPSELSVTVLAASSATMLATSSATGRKKFFDSTHPDRRWQRMAL